VILYQEQVLRIAHELAGFSLAEADLLRRAMSHFDPGKQMQTLKEKFIAGVLQRHKIPADTAERIWELMAAFAGYGFPKAHAASYAQIAWRAAWSKVHHPAIFMAAVLANWGGYYSQRVYLNEARRLGLALRAPHINYAQKEFSVQYLGQQPVLFMGLEQVRDLTRNTQKRLLAERPFHSLTDFLVRVDPRPQEAENLIRIGALQDLGAIPALLRQLKKQDWKSGQFPLFDAPSAGPEEDWPIESIIADQEAILGAAVIAHPLELAAERIKAAGAISTVEAIQCPGQTVRVAGMRQTWRRGKNARGEVYYFMSLEDLEGMLDVFIPGEVYRRYRSAFIKPGPWIIEGVLEPDPTSSECTLRAARIELLE
jgi:DNA polymerase III alpha subunit